ncbi:thiamine pyrophosphate-dependent dehydrogenase E1 component subunit alpha [Vulgatibacter incomptus]|uniref:2-oxoisovalerate dehydrogenase subunit alpha n=1 Tax=Vulgatibacter incomptus TaxID=1391653 RepID=A0A0K1PDX3_9BACT|nr:thiamine pyrophosphate-dependent enzyme [Vulgatibacter incomptus]AKU91733.1 Branched-chain alpha-keto acid dehydrogenase, E1 component, alpha subunit [Vulgatibacter incomptus]
MAKAVGRSKAAKAQPAAAPKAKAAAVAKATKAPAAAVAAKAKAVKAPPAPKAKTAGAQPMMAKTARGADRAKGVGLPDDVALRLYRSMLRIRTVDERMMTLQRQGRIGFYGACTGQEAAYLAAAIALEPSDWIFPALRESSAMLMRGFPLVPYLAQVFGNALDETKGRQMPSHPASRSVNQVSWGSCIGTQLPQAVGAAWAAKLRGDSTVVLAFMGDGATSAADFHTALNFAGVFKVPVVFICQNNHWAISISTKGQTASETYAMKAAAYGFPGVKVDGNDAKAVYAAATEAIARARRGEGPTLLECETYRMGAHSSSDDPSRYRDQAEVDAWAKRDPIQALFRELCEGGLWSEEKDKALRDELLAEVNEAIAAAEAGPDPEPETLFDDVFGELPWHLREQRDECLASLAREKAGA